jgi:hypothetical protein
MRYVSLFRKNNPSPWNCYFCGEEVIALLVHHVDHDHSNNDLGNLVAAHKKCHDQHHQSGRVVTWGHKISAIRKRQWAEGVYANKRPPVEHHSEETKDKISKAKRGVPASEERKAALKRAWEEGRYANRKRRTVWEKFI